MERFEIQKIATSEEQLRLPQSILEFLITNERRKTVEMSLEQHDIEAIVLVDDPCPSKPITARELGYAQDAIRHIRHLTTVEEVTIEESNARLTATGDWMKLCDDIKTENQVRIREKDKGSILITGFKDDVRKAAQKLQTFLDINSIEQDEYVCPSSDILEYVIRYREEDLRNMESVLGEFDVHYSGHGEDLRIYISGRRKGLEQSKKYLDNLISSIVVATPEGSHPGFRRYFERDGRGDRWVRTIEREQNCLIRVEKNFYLKQDSSDIVTAQGQTITWKIGDIAKEKVKRNYLFYLNVIMRKDKPLIKPPPQTLLENTLRVPFRLSFRNYYFLWSLVGV